MPFGSSGSVSSSNSGSPRSTHDDRSSDSETTGDENDYDESFFFGGGTGNTNDIKIKRYRQGLHRDMKQKKRYRSKLNIVVVHLDLGIGGAEINGECGYLPFGAWGTM